MKIEIFSDVVCSAHRLLGAVPTFVFDGKYVIEGAQSTPTFLHALEEVAASPAPGVVAAREAR